MLRVAIKNERVHLFRLKKLCKTFSKFSSKANDGFQEVQAFHLSVQHIHLCTEDDLTLSRNVCYYFM